MDIKEIKTLFDDMNSAFTEFKKTNDERLAKVEKGEGVAEITEKLDRMEAVIAKGEEAQQEFERREKANAEKMAELEAELDMVARTGGDHKESKAAREYKELFFKWMRACRDDAKPSQSLTNELHAKESEIPELKAITGSSGGAGGAAIPSDLARLIHDQVRLISPIRDLVTVRSIGTRTYSEVMNLHGETSGWVAEEGARSETSTPAFRTITPTMGTLYAYPRATEEALDDVFFDVGSFLLDVTSQEFTDAETTAILTGNGTARPTGLLNTAPVTTDDDASPARAAAALEYVPLSTASPVAGIQADQLITLMYTLRAPYRQNATWLMNSSVVGSLRSLKDTTNQYLWQPGLQAGAPSQLLGRPVRIVENMSGLTADQFPIAYGDFRRGYLLVDRVGLRVTVDDNITTPGYVKWYVRRREGGIVLDNNAVKVGKYANS